MYTALSIVSEIGIELDAAKEGASIDRMQDQLSANLRQIRALERQPKARRKLAFEKMANDRSR